MNLNFDKQPKPNNEEGGDKVNLEKKESKEEVIEIAETEKILEVAYEANFEAIKGKIIQKIDELVEKFPEIKFKYEYMDYDGSTHIISIEPKEIYEANEELKKAVWDFQEKIGVEFPSQLVGFIDDMRDNDLEDIEYVKEGNLFKK